MDSAQPHWAGELEKVWSVSDDAVEKIESGDLTPLQCGLQLLTDRQIEHPNALRGQLLDAHLLALSPVYARSRELFLLLGGVFLPVTTSRIRSVTSPALLDDVLPYNPVADELLWFALEPKRSSHYDPKVMHFLKEMVTPVFHEQNHRIFWHLLPAAPREPDAMFRYMRFSEALALTMDTALSRDVGYVLSSFFNASGPLAIFSSQAVHDMESEASVHQYLFAFAYASYLNLELYRPSDILEAMPAIFPECPEIAQQAARSALSDLTIEFVRISSRVWERDNLEYARAVLSPGGRLHERPDSPTFDPGSDPSRFLAVAEPIIRKILEDIALPQRPG